MSPVRIVLHDTESHDAEGIADIAAVFAFWRRQGLGYGAHFVVDGDGNIGQGGYAHQMLYHVGGMNTGSVGIEQIGFASFTRTMWSRRRRKQFMAVARLLAYLSDRHDIPLVVATGSGVCTHAMVSALGLPGSSGHYDPGKNYPLYAVVLTARAIKRANRKRGR